jgi:hypothetical protein
MSEKAANENPISVFQKHLSYPVELAGNKDAVEYDENGWIIVKPNAADKWNLKQWEKHSKRQYSMSAFSGDGF